MSKKVLLLSSSSRRGGNSDLLCDQFLCGVLETGNQAEKILLKDKRIGYCTGCEVCFNSHKCIQKDDMAVILDKMLAADVIVMATPVYFYSMNAQMKTLIDRTVPKYEDMSSKEFYFIITANDHDKRPLERVLDSFRGFTYCLKDPKEKGIIYGTGVWHKGDIIGSQAMDEAYEMGRNV